MSRSRREIIDENVVALGMDTLFPGAVFVEAWHSDATIQSKWERLGFIAAYPLYKHGLSHGVNGYPIGLKMVLHGSEYSKVMDGIAATERSEQMTTISSQEAMQHILDGTLEQSEYARFLP